MTNWQKLIVSDMDGNTGNTLISLLHSAPANFDSVKLNAHGGIESWMGFFIHANEEIPDYNTPKQQVNWDGFIDALNSIRN